LTAHRSAHRALWIIDDNTIDLRLATRAHQAGAIEQRLRTFSSVALLLEELERTDDKPDLILIDVRMPEMDGFSLLETLRSRPGLTGTSKLAFFTTSEYPSDRQRAEELGCGYYVKPDSMQELTALFRRLAEGA